jgi:biopolymer transport protein TolR
MARDRRRQRLDEDSFDRIDVVPLLDLAFNLLIVFMICMPALESRLKLPTSGNDTPKNPTEIIIGYNRDGQISMDRVDFSEEGLVEKLKEIGDQPNTIFVLKGDESRPYGEVMHILGLIKGAGIKKVTLATKVQKKT